MDTISEKEEQFRLKNVSQLLTFSVPLFKGYGGRILFLTLILIIEATSSASFPLITRYIIDHALMARDGHVLIIGLGFLAGAGIVFILAGFISDYIWSKLSSAAIRSLRFHMFKHLQHLSLSFFTQSKTGDTLSRFSGDLTAVENTFSSFTSWGIKPLLDVVYYTALMFILSPSLALIGLLLFPLILFGSRLFAFRALSLGYLKKNREASMMNLIQENVSSQPIVKVFGLEKIALIKFDRMNKIWQRIADRVNFFSTLTEHSAYMGIIIVDLLVFGVGAYWVFKGQITIGTLVAFEEIFLNLGHSLNWVTQYLPNLSETSGAIGRIQELYNQKPEIVDAANAVPCSPLKRDINFKEVTFCYPQRSFSLRNFNLHIPKGSFTALVGASGSGKSSAISLLVRLYDPTDGFISIDDFDLRTITQESLRSQISIVFQDTFLYHASIMENIRVGNPKAHLNQVKKVAQLAEIHEFIEKLPHGYHTIVGERGTQLSSGQRQRIAIARALLHNPTILILDEATSSLDYATEASINETIAQIHREGLTIVSATHRLSSIQKADQILVLEHGQIVETGTHAELLRRQGPYSKLWNMQQLEHKEKKLAA